MRRTSSIADAARVLRVGGVVAYPTDTLYGLAVDPRSDAAIEKLYALKRRPPGLAIPLIASDLEQAAIAGNFGPDERRLAALFWPGPLSIVTPASAQVSRLALGGGTTVALRVPAHPLARALASALGFCITSTSANPSGGLPTASPDDVLRAMGEEVEALDLLLDGGLAPGGPPSTIVAIESGVPVLVRAGAIAWERVLKSLQ